MLALRVRLRMIAIIVVTMAIMLGCSPGSTAATLGNQCNTDEHCHVGEYCNLKTKSCVNCLTNACAKWKRSNGTSSCPKSQDECGPCLPGYAIEHDHCEQSTGPPVKISPNDHDTLDEERDEEDKSAKDPPGLSVEWKVAISSIVFLIIGLLLGIGCWKRCQHASNNSAPNHTKTEELPFINETNDYGPPRQPPYNPDINPPEYRMESGYPIINNVGSRFITRDANLQHNNLHSAVAFYSGNFATPGAPLLPFQDENYGQVAGADQNMLPAPLGEGDQVDGVAVVPLAAEEVVVNLEAAALGEQNLDDNIPVVAVDGVAGWPVNGVVPEADFGEVAGVPDPEVGEAVAGVPAHHANYLQMLLHADTLVDHYHNENGDDIDPYDFAPDELAMGLEILNAAAEPLLAQAPPVVFQFAEHPPPPPDVDMDDSGSGDHEVPAYAGQEENSMYDFENRNVADDLENMENPGYQEESQMPGFLESYMDLGNWSEAGLGERAVSAPDISQASSAAAAAALNPVPGSSRALNNSDDSGNFSAPSTPEEQQPRARQGSSRMPQADFSIRIHARLRFIGGEPEASVDLAAIQDQDNEQMQE